MFILIGMPGSGKTTAGRQLARRFSFPFLDCDQILVDRLGMPVTDYFAQHGEAAFRDAESALVEELAHQKPQAIVSTGGGVVLRAQNRQRLHSAGKVLYLSVRPEELFRRLQHDTKRPLLQVADPRQKLYAMHRERDPLYRQTAHVVIEAARASMPYLVNQLAMQIDMLCLASPDSESSDLLG